jgi:hypothetical protein
MQPKPTMGKRQKKNGKQRKPHWATIETLNWETAKSTRWKTSKPQFEKQRKPQVGKHQNHNWETAKATSGKTPKPQFGNSEHHKGETSKTQFGNSKILIGEYGNTPVPTTLSTSCLDQALWGASQAGVGFSLGPNLHLWVALPSPALQNDCACGT